MKLLSLVALLVCVVGSGCSGRSNTFHDEAAKQCVDDGGIQRYQYEYGALTITCANGTHIVENYSRDN
jgi:hypothetical protein